MDSAAATRCPRLEAYQSKEHSISANELAHLNILPSVNLGVPVALDEDPAIDLTFGEMPCP